jgi:hypothetical protein
MVDLTQLTFFTQVTERDKNLKSIRNSGQIHAPMCAKKRGVPRHTHTQHNIANKKREMLALGIRMDACVWTSTLACVAHLFVPYTSFRFPCPHRVDALLCSRPPLAYGNRPLQLCFPRAHGDRLHRCSISSTRGLPVCASAASHARFTRELHAQRPNSCSRW